MNKIKSLEDLRKLREEVQKKLKSRGMSSHAEQAVQVKVAMSTCGIASGAKEIMNYFLEELEHRSIEAVVSQTGCMGYCYAEPTIEITIPGKEAVVFSDVTIAKANEIIEKYIIHKELVDGIIPASYKTIDHNN